MANTRIHLGRLVAALVLVMTLGPEQSPVLSARHDSAFGGSANPLAAVPSLVADGEVRTPTSRQATVPGDERWDSRFSPAGTDGDVFAVLSLGQTIVAGGAFDSAGNQRARRIARYFPQNAAWAPLAFGLNGTVRALVATDAGDIVAGGDFTGACLDSECLNTTPVNGIARYSGGQWQPIANGLSGPVYALAVSGTVIYAGGSFERACDTAVCSGGTRVNSIAQYTPANGIWRTLGAGLAGPVLAMTRSPQGALIAGGLFFRACPDDTCGPTGTRLNYLGAFDGSSWQSLRFGLNGPVLALGYDSSGRLNVGGAFTGNCMQSSCDSVEFSRQNFARFVAGAWLSTGPSFNAPVMAIQSAGADVYVGGSFELTFEATPGPKPMSFISRVSGNSANAVAGGLDGPVSAIAIVGKGIAVGGRFSVTYPEPLRLGSVPLVASRIARFESEWSALGAGEGANGEVLAIVANGNDVYVGGRFTTIGGIVANRIARWNRLTGIWTALGNGLEGAVHAITVAGNGDVYVGGDFAGACAVLRCDFTTGSPNVARFSGGAWQSLANGVSGPVYAIAMTGTSVYAGGAFTVANNTSGSVTVNRIARFATGVWAPLGAGVDNDVLTIKLHGSRVYAGGAFVAALPSGPNPTVNINRIGYFNGTGWSGLKFGADNRVSAIDVDSAGVVTAGGSFTVVTDDVGPKFSPAVARFDGNFWSPVDFGLNGEVIALARSGGSLYAGGVFTSSCNGTPPVSCLSETQTSRVASLTAGQWSPLASGVRLGADPAFAAVRAIGVVGPDVFVGGDFRLAGEKPSWNLGRYGETADLIVSQSVTPNPVASGTPVTFTVTATNTGKSTALGVSLITTIPARSQLVALLATGGTCTTVPVIRCDAPSVGQNGTLTVRVVISTAAVGNAVNVVSVQSALVDPTPANNVSRRGVIVQTAPVSGFGELVPPVNGVVYALSRRPLGGRPTVAGVGQESETTVYAGGAFTTAGGMTVNFVAQLDPLTLGWNSIGGGLDGPVLALAASGSTLYTGGGFTLAGGVPANFVAQYDPVNGWNAMAGGMNGPVQSLATLGGGVVAGGQFSQAGGQPANFVAHYDTVTGWTALGAGTNGPVMAVAIAGSMVIIGGSFSQAGTASTANLAFWNGTTWQAPNGGGTNGPVETITVNGSELYVGGAFSLAGGQPANNIAKYDLNTGTWSALGSGTNGTVEATSTSGSDLFVGGAFTLAGDQPVGYLAKWDGIDWAPVGEGTNATVFALVTNGPTQYIGGAFTEAGGLPVGYITRFGPPRTSFPRQTLVAIGVNRRFE